MDNISTQIEARRLTDRKSTRLNSSHSQISYAVFCLKKKKYSNPSLPNSWHVKCISGFSSCIDFINIIHRLCVHSSIPFMFNHDTALPMPLSYSDRN